MDSTPLKLLHDHQQRVIEKPQYQCYSCDEFFPGEELEEVPWLDRQCGDRHLFLFCQKPKCQRRKELLP